MPLYDCGDEDCEECKRAFGPDRSKAIARFKSREEAYAALGIEPDSVERYMDAAQPLRRA